MGLRVRLGHVASWSLLRRLWLEARPFLGSLLRLGRGWRALPAAESNGIPYAGQEARRLLQAEVRVFGRQAALIVLIFSLSSSSAAGWASAEVLAPPIISVFLLLLFFVYETKIPEATAAV